MPKSKRSGIILWSGPPEMFRCTQGIDPKVNVNLGGLHAAMRFAKANRHITRYRLILEPVKRKAKK